MSSCKQATVLLSQKLERKLTKRETAALWMHLLICKACRITSRQFSFIRVAARQLGSPGD